MNGHCGSIGGEIVPPVNIRIDQTVEDKKTKDLLGLVRTAWLQLTFAMELK